MTALILIADTFFVVGLVIGAYAPPAWTLAYPVAVAAILSALVLSGVLFGEDHELGPALLVVFALAWTALPAALGAMLGAGGRRMKSRG